MIVNIRQGSLWLCALTCLVSTGIAAAPTATLRGTINEISVGTTVPEAYIIVHDDIAGSGRVEKQMRPDITLRPDRRGRFSTQLEPGFYDVCILAVAFTPDCRKVLLKQSEATDLRIRLKIDPEVVKQLGDKFPKR